MEHIEVVGWWTEEPVVVSVRCPACRQIGTFEASAKDLKTKDDGYLLGSRRCPNPDCHAHIFTVWSLQTAALVASYPPVTLEFDSTNLPKPVLDSLEESVKCHAAQCYRAAALMIRRTLEDLCADRGATGSNLKERLGNLAGKVAVAGALIDGLDTLRLLGNDAAHVELQDFDSVGKTEAELAIEITTELLKGIYQYDDLVARLEALKRPGT